MHPDLIILDIRLPDIDGYEVTRRLRGDRRTANIPIIYLVEKRGRSKRLAFKIGILHSSDGLFTSLDVLKSSLLRK